MQKVKCIFDIFPLFSFMSSYPFHNSQIALALEHALQVLNKTDPSVEVEWERSGQAIIAASGELHLER
jgi:hypothetical protein